MTATYKKFILISILLTRLNFLSADIPNDGMWHNSEHYTHKSTENSKEQNLTAEEIATRKKDCERFRQTIQELEYFLNNNIYSLPGQRQPLLQQRTQAIKDLHWLRISLKTNYCTQVE